MQSSETIGTQQFAGLTPADGARWLFAAMLVAALGSAGVLLTRNWTPPPGEASLAAPAILLELTPLPTPEPEPEIAPPDPVAEPATEPPADPEVEPPPPEPEPTPPVIEPDPLPPSPPVEKPVQEPDPVTEPPPPETPETEPEPIETPEPESLPEAEAPAVVFPMPAIMSADIRQQRLDTPATNPQRPRQTPRPERPRAQPTPPSQSAPSPSQPAAAAAGPTPQQWQQQVLRHLDRRKTYPRQAQRAGQEGVVQIRFSIDASGRILSVSLAASSGVPALDQAALDTARRASPVPKPPASAGQGTLSLTAAIRFTLR